MKYLYKIRKDVFEDNSEYRKMQSDSDAEDELGCIKMWNYEDDSFNGPRNGVNNIAPKNCFKTQLRYNQTFGFDNHFIMVKYNYRSWLGESFDIVFTDNWISKFLIFQATLYFKIQRIIFNFKEKIKKYNTKPIEKFKYSNELIEV